MGRSSPKTPFNVDNLPSEHEVSNYDRTTGDCCDLLDFRPDLRGQIDSDWNQSVINVFVAYYLASEEWCVEHDEDRVASHAEQHLKYLIIRFGKQMSSPEARRALDQKRARDERKRQVSQFMFSYMSKFISTKTASSTAYSCCTSRERSH